MKKYLLGALLLGTVSYALDNKIIVPVANEKASANLGIEVAGEVFAPANLSLVVDIKSAAATNGSGFAFTMPQMFAGVNQEKILQGDFEVYVEKSGVKVPFVQNLSVKLAQGGTEGATATTAAPLGTAKGISLDYSLIGGDGTGTATKLIHNGGVVVKAKAETATEGTYSDTSVQLKVVLTGQTSN